MGQSVERRPDERRIGLSIRQADLPEMLRYTVPDFEDEELYHGGSSVTEEPEVDLPGEEPENGNPK